MKSGLYDDVDEDAGALPPLPGTDPVRPRGSDPLRGSFVSPEKPSIWRGVGLGLLATAVGLAVAELIVGLVKGSASPVVPVGQEFINIAPQWLVEWGKRTFGTDQKSVLVAGAVIVVFGLGSLIGVMAVRGERGFAYGLTVAIGVLGAWAVWLRPGTTLGKLAPTVVGSIVSVAVLWWLMPRRSPDSPTGEPMVGPDRRQFVQGAVAVGSVAAVTGGVGRVLQRRFAVDTDFALPGQTLDAGAGDSPADTVVPAGDVVVDRATSVQGAELGVDGIVPFVVPNDDFYRIDTALVVPQVSSDSWRLSIDGLVDNPIELTFADLLARDQVERHITLSCVSNPIGGDLVGNALWQGVLLKPLLEEAGLQAGAEQLVSRSVDGWTCGSPIEAIMDGRDAMLAFGMNGEPLPAQHGFPVRIVVPGLFGYVSATKWLTDIRLTRWEDFDGYWIPRGWSKLGPVKTMARIDTPRSGASRDGVVPIGGVAWAVNRGVSEVQVRIGRDDGEMGEWTPAELGSVPTADTWVQWVHRWDTAGLDGVYIVEVRAIDGDGEPQPEEPRAVAPDGAQGYHRIAIEIG
ncbi:MAG: molybdopterin-dependent oxidoreductase [Ilumatobacter sp.]|uniref:molybdopterin-dependent oxidoreductase n=1 Tax=Ilumatobacter sp. TaxID=1967498 RepID=UPI003299E0AE